METSTEEKTSKITELCLAGGGNRGICYIGCIKKLEELDLLRIKKLAGTSIGAMIGACYLIGYSADEMLKIVIEKQAQDFKDFSFSEQGAILKGQLYRQWVYNVFAKKVDPDITLLQLFNKTGIEFIMTATCIHSARDEFKEGINYFSHILTPDLPLITAVNASSAFPFIFPPINYKGHQFIDGGVLDNFPIEYLSSDALGIKVTFRLLDGSQSTRNPISYVGKIFELISIRLKDLSPGKSKNILSIDCDDFNIIDFEMSIDDKLTLYKRGYYSMESFITTIFSAESFIACAKIPQ